MRVLLVTAMFAVLCGCGERSENSGHSPNNSEPIAWTNGPAECYWELRSRSGPTRLAAWVLTDLDGDNGTAIAFADGARFPDVPLGDNLPVRLIADGDTSKSTSTLGFHPPGQGAYMLSAILGSNQRQALDGAGKISIEFDGRTVATVTGKNFPSLTDLAACDHK